MKEKQRAELEQRLQKERDKTIKAIQKAEGNGDTGEGAAARDEPRFRTHMADQGSDVEEREREFMIAAMKSDLLTKIDEALDLLISDPDSFEKCERCGTEIAWERFELLPWTRLCSRCAAQDEGGRV